MTAKVITQPPFLPVCQADLDKLGWDGVDIILIQGDAYIDHPAQGPALLGRWLIAHGFTVGLISQPRWQGPDDFLALGQPQLFAAISAGALDSMLAHYTAFRKKRSDDALTPGGRAGTRPNRATLVYTGLARAAFPNKPVIIGGLEASLRRFSHYDFWQDKLRRPILLEAKADLLVYGPGEVPLLEIARRLSAGDNDLSGIGGTVEAVKDPSPGCLILPSHEEIEADHFKLMMATQEAERLVHLGEKAPAAFQASAARAIMMHPPAKALTGSELDFIYALPFSRKAHPSYKEKIPALEMLAASITSHRGCGGGCSFCSLALHQGRHIISRSLASIKAEAEKLAVTKPVALSDVGAGTANLWGAKCLTDKPCARASCLWPTVCQHLKADQRQWVDMLKTLAGLKNVKQVRVASGVRFDLALTDLASLRFFLQNFVGGQLKIAPEHLDPGILKLMRKPPAEVFEKFLDLFESGQPHGTKSTQYVIPYLISAFPGCGRKEMDRLAAWFHKRGWRPQQTQAFIPTPGTVATAMYYAECDDKGHKIFVAKSDSERLIQHMTLMKKSGPEAGSGRQAAASGHARRNRGR